MALQKQQISIDLVSGTDTKINNQVSDKNQDMVNVVFTGDITAKKMNGYNLLATLPANEKYSSLFTRTGELLAQTDKGAYRYLPASSDFKKIDEIGAGKLSRMDSYGEVFCTGTSYNMHAGFTQRTTNTAGSQFLRYYMVHSFTDKEGGVLNTIETEVTSTLTSTREAVIMRWVKIVSYENSFFIIRPTTTNKTVIQKFTYDSSSKSFISSALVSFDGTAGRRAIQYECIFTSDIYTDGTNLYWAVKDVSVTPGCEIYKLDFSTLATVSNVTFGSGLLYSSIKIHSRNSTSIYISYCAFNSSATPGTVISAFLIQNYYQKSDLSLILGYDNIIATTNATAGFEFPNFINYPLTDLTSKYFYSRTFLVTAVGSPSSQGFTFGPFYKCDSYFGSSQSIYTVGLAPIGEIFVENGVYYAPFVSCIGVNQVFHLINIATGSSVATMAKTSVSQNDYYSFFIYNLTGGITSTALYSIKNIYNNGAGWVIPTKDIVSLGNNPTTQLFIFSSTSSSINSQIEMNGKSNIFNSQASYYDGQDFSELGFSNKPFLVNLTLASTGGFLVDGTYQIVAIYKWRDSSGDVFYSDISNIVGSNYPLVISNGTTTSKVALDIHTPMVSTKSNVEIIIYMKKGSDAFTKNQSFFIKPQTDASQNGTYNVIITAYAPQASNNTLQDYFLYATSTFVAGGDYTTSALTSCIASAVYEDRIFVITNDNPTSVAYSQKRLAGYGPEFNTDIFYLDVYDKRGVYEDKLSALMAMDGRLFIFKERSVLYIVGSGPSRANTNDDLSSPQLVTTDVGCTSSRSLVLVPAGIMFMSDKGIYLLDRKLGVSYIGAPVERFNGNTVTSAILLEKVNEVRFTTLEGEVLVYNYFSQAWSWFTNLPCASACMWKGSYTMLLTSGKVYAETTAHKKIIENGASTAIIQKISTPWVRIQAKQAWAKVYETMILGRYKTPHQVKVSFYYDYELYPSNVYILDPLASTDYNVATRPSDTSIESGAKYDGVYQLLIDMVRKNCEAFRLEIEDIPLDIANNTGESFALSNLEVTVGLKKNPVKLNPEKTY